MDAARRRTHRVAKIETTNTRMTIPTVAKIETTNMRMTIPTAVEEVKRKLDQKGVKKIMDTNQPIQPRVRKPQNGKLPTTSLAARTAVNQRK